jgi:beta-glucosidase/6-phospho-beta-glucosidase/beta-galactosidase
MMQSLGLKHFRMSLSWSRLLPDGTPASVNQKGVDFYNNVLDALIAAGIEPWVTLFHWDLPSALQDKTDKGAWLGD